MKKIVVVGVPGSGKSTFAYKLGKILSLPVYSLDRIVLHGKHKRKREAFLKDHAQLVAKEAWIIEGCGIRTLADRAKHADIVIFLTCSRLTSFYRLFKRMLFCPPQLKDSGCLRGMNRSLVGYIWRFPKEKVPAIQEALKGVRTITLSSAKATDEFLKTLTPTPP